MENWNDYVDIGCGIPQYAVMETLRAMRDNAEPDPEGGFDFVAKCKDPFCVGSKEGFGASILANANCIGMKISCIEISQSEPDEFDAYFDLEKRGRKP